MVLLNVDRFGKMIAGPSVGTICPVTASASLRGPVPPGTAAGSGVEANVLSVAATLDPFGLLCENVRRTALVPCPYGPTLYIIGAGYGAYAL